MSCFLCSNALVPREIRAITFQSRPGTSILYAGERKLSPISCTRLDNSQRATTTDQQQLNLSVLRFTLGIRGLDESYLPRWIGYTFGSLLLLNHFVGSDSATITPVQLRSEALGLSLAGFSVVLPFLGKFLKIEESQISCQDSQFSYQLSQSSQPSQRAKIQVLRIIPPKDPRQKGANVGRLYILPIKDREATQSDGMNLGVDIGVQHVEASLEHAAGSSAAANMKGEGKVVAAAKAFEALQSPKTKSQVPKKKRTKSEIAKEDEAAQQDFISVGDELVVASVMNGNKGLPGLVLALTAAEQSGNLQAKGNVTGTQQLEHPRPKKNRKEKGKGVLGDCSKEQAGGAPLVDQAPVPENAVQIFVMSQHLAENFKEDLAWGTYVLLRNTNTISVLISVQDALCVRGYWNVERDLSKVDAVDWFQKLIQRSGLSDLKDTLYFSQIADSELREMLPKGIRSLLVQPVPQTPKGVVNQIEKALGFVLLASTISYAYSDKDRAWVGAIANKFKALAALPSGIR